MEPSIFTKIIRGEIPSHKIYEDKHAFAFLDINPTQPGHTLVVPKNQVDRLEDLTENEYAALLDAVKKIMRRVVTVYGQEYRACLKVEGFDVPHAHVHIIPCRSAHDFWAKSEPHWQPDHTALAREAERLAFSE